MVLAMAKWQVPQECSKCSSAPQSLHNVDASGKVLPVMLTWQSFASYAYICFGVCCANVRFQKIVGLSPRMDKNKAEDLCFSWLET